LSLLLNTHFWIWWLTPRSPLKSVERNALDAAAEAGGVCLAAISLWEAQLLHSKQRLELPLPFSDWLTRATESRVPTVLPLDRDVVVALDDFTYEIPRRSRRSTHRGYGPYPQHTVGDTRSCYSSLAHH
jgi:PIN domain nuclease of toxin-antitoxin system